MFFSFGASLQHFFNVCISSLLLFDSPLRYTPLSLLFPGGSGESGTAAAQQARALRDWARRRTQLMVGRQHQVQAATAAAASVLVSSCPCSGAVRGCLNISPLSSLLSLSSTHSHSTAWRPLVVPLPPPFAVPPFPAASPQIAAHFRSQRQSVPQEFHPEHTIGDLIHALAHHPAMSVGARALCALCCPSCLNLACCTSSFFNRHTSMF